MATVHKTYHETSTTDIMLAIVRVILGAILIFVGIQFGRNPHDILEEVGSTSGFMSLFVIHYIMMCHFTGGVLLILGLLTRLAAGVQIPILLGAMALTVDGEGYGSIYTQFWFVLLVFVMLVAVTYFGAGRYSLDDAMKERKRA